MRAFSVALLALLTMACNPDGDGDGHAESEDCDDDNAAVNPDADELCNDVDDDCNGEVDDDAVDATTWYADVDLDSYGDPATAQDACDAPADHIAQGGDCNDGVRQHRQRLRRDHQRSRHRAVREARRLHGGHDHHPDGHREHPRRGLPGGGRHAVGLRGHVVRPPGHHRQRRGRGQQRRPRHGGARRGGCGHGGDHERRRGRGDPRPHHSERQSVGRRALFCRQRERVRRRTVVWSRRHHHGPAQQRRGPGLGRGPRRRDVVRALRRRDRGLADHRECGVLGRRRCVRVLRARGGAKLRDQLEHRVERRGHVRAARVHDAHELAVHGQHRGELRRRLLPRRQRHRDRGHPLLGQHGRHWGWAVRPLLHRGRTDLLRRFGGPCGVREQRGHQQRRRERALRRSRFHRLRLRDLGRR
ncbi:MAG: putative metal-binding motif-containing protein [Deltaproteobacteria bacterium]|nr:putative metal-binding motif-containing protein [Deltaproteobacteria bacterium]